MTSGGKIMWYPIFRRSFRNKSATPDKNCGNVFPVWTGVRWYPFNKCEPVVTKESWCCQRHKDMVEESVTYA